MKPWKQQSLFANLLAEENIFSTFPMPQHPYDRSSSSRFSCGSRGDQHDLDRRGTVRARAADEIVAVLDPAALLHCRKGSPESIVIIIYFYTVSIFVEAILPSAACFGKLVLNCTEDIALRFSLRIKPSQSIYDECDRSKTLEMLMSFALAKLRKFRLSIPDDNA
ncbi:hypothetical protein ACCO45_009882 [Purpureocillium lilacinum]|uniref:Uncharacterized protein n=1 Tax=Purpureocillium lilacinum TaxID=33203 RepID=A0ACC4DIM8_PURLI